MTKPAQTPQPEPQQPKAVALRYDESSNRAPEVVASGVGDVAERILALAEEKGIPVHQDADLVALLAACDLGEEIPVELYEAVAGLLSWLYGMNSVLRSG